MAEGRIDHAQQARDYLAHADRIVTDPVMEQRFAALAQAHATLALVEQQRRDANAPKVVTFADETELDQAFAEHGEYALAFVSAIGDFLIVGQTEDGDCFYQGMPEALNEEGTEVADRNGWVRDLREIEWPLTLMVSAANGTPTGRDPR